MPRRLLFPILMLLFWVAGTMPCQARVAIPAKWGITLSAQDSAAIRRSAAAFADSALRVSVTGSSAGRLVYQIQHYRPYKNLTLDFYLLCGLCILLGAIRYFDPRYFALLLGAYRNPGSGCQWRDMLKATALPNLGMNIFFTVVLGTYIYYLSSGGNYQWQGVRAPLVLPLLIAGMMVTYAAKYAVIRFSGWAFKVEALADQYLFNVFLVNKITAIVLLPFVIIIAFAGKEWLHPMGVVSGIVVLALFASRYLRSWSLFLSFFEGSRFHSFTYLCASEILPMAVLVKWLLHLLH